MYEDYFGLDRPPFKITPDTSLFYEGGKRGDILGALVYAIQRGEGIVKVVGEVGSGKTMLCRMLQLKLPKSVEIVYIANPSVSPEDILFVIAHELSLPVSRDESKHKVMHSLQDYLLKRHMENRQVVLFIEEAQGMPLETLEEIRLLSNLETDQNKLLQIILFGQPELDENLSRQSIRQLRERITHNFHLEPLTRDEIHTYLNFRMREVGYRGPELINRKLAKKVEQHSGGLLRRINIIADKILLSAYAEGTHNLSAKHVNAAVNDSAFNPGPARRGGAIWWFALVLLAALLFALYQTRGQWLSVAASTESGGPQQRASIGVPAEGTGASPVPREVGDEARDGGMRGVPAAAADAGDDATAITGVAAAAQTDVPAPAAGGVEPEQARRQPPGEATPVPHALAASTIASEQTVPAGLQTAMLAEAERTAPLVAAPAGADELPAAGAGADADPPIAGTPAAGAAAPDPAAGTQAAAAHPADADDDQWLKTKLDDSRQWLAGVQGDKVSIQVMMRKKSAVRELVYHLRNDWPLDINKTYVYEVVLGNRSIYRVLYSEFDSVALGKRQIEELPASVKNNSPYLHSVRRLQKALL